MFVCFVVVFCFFVVVGFDLLLFLVFFPPLLPPISFSPSVFFFLFFSSSFSSFFLTPGRPSCVPHPDLGVQGGARLCGLGPGLYDLGLV